MQPLNPLNKEYITVNNSLDVSKIKTGKIECSKYGKLIPITYNNRSLLIKTDEQECPYGFNQDFNNIKIFPSEFLYQIIKKLDNYALEILNEYRNDLELPKLDHPIKQTDDCLDDSDNLNSSSDLNLFNLYEQIISSNHCIFSIHPECQIFNTECLNITEKKTDSIYGGRFTSKMLIHVVGLQVKNSMKCKISISINQMRILSTSKLPPGCLIFENEEDLIKHLSLSIQSSSAEN